MKEKGITIITLAVTIIVLLILAGISLATITGENGIISKAKQTKQESIRDEIEEIISVTSMETFNECGELNVSVFKEKLKRNFEDTNIKFVEEKDKIIVTVKGYEVIIDKENGDIVSIKKGIHQISGSLYQTDGSALVEGIKYTEIILTIKISDEEKLESIDEIKVTNSDGIEIAENNSVIGDGIKSYKITANSIYKVVVKVSSDGLQETLTKQITISGIIQVTEFSRENGEIDIKFLSEDGDNIADEANKPVLGNMIPVNFNSNTNSWDEVTEENWNYSYNNTAGTSEWANAVVKDESGNITGYFVWIPRYAYKITYYAESAHTNVVGYSDSRGIVHADGNELISATNRRKVGNNYIVHPSFINDVTVGGWSKELKGIWVAKYETTGNMSTGVTVLPATQSWTRITIGEMYTKAESYNTNLNSHMMKNSEWGAVAYLAYSNYGLGYKTEIEINTSSDYYTGGAATEKEIYTTNVGQSTTGNAYGIYDMSGGAYESTATYINNGFENLDIYGNTFATSDKSKAISTEKVTAYKASNSENDRKSNYQLSGEIMYGDAVYETSIIESGDSGAWQSDGINMPYNKFVFFVRSGLYNYTSKSGIFYLSHYIGIGNPSYGFRLALCP